MAQFKLKQAVAAAILLSLTPAWIQARTLREPSASAFSASLSLRDFFQQAYGQEGRLYRANQCGRNIKELLLEMKKNGFDIQSTKVLFLLNELRRPSPGWPPRPGSLTPSYSRRQVKAWDFHVILQINNPLSRQALILDLDGPSRPMSIDDYFNLMFPSSPGTDRLEKITVREVDSQKYLEAFEIYHQSRGRGFSPDENDVVGYFRKLDLPEFPVSSLRSHLNKSRSGY